MSLIFDLETDGLLDTVSTIHVLAIHDTDTQRTDVYNDRTLSDHITEGISRLADADYIIGHNIIGYDIPVIRKFFGWWDYSGCILDTLLLSRLYHPNIIDVDKKRQWKHMPLQLYGRHSLESYGYRLGEYKGEYGKTSDWKEWSEEMQEYCIQDTNVTTKLWKHFQKYLTGS